MAHCSRLTWQSPETVETSDLVIVRWRAVLSDVPRAAGGRLADAAVQLVALAAFRMIRVTMSAREIRARWPALTSVMRAPARWAMDCSKAGGMTLSAVPITAQDGMVFQAGVPDGSPSVLAASGRCVAAMIAAVGAGRPLAKQPGTRAGLM